jgi:hypothetical protein
MSFILDKNSTASTRLLASFPQHKYLWHKRTLLMLNTWTWSHKTRVAGALVHIRKPEAAAATPARGSRISRVALNTPSLLISGGQASEGMLWRVSSSGQLHARACVPSPRSRPQACTRALDAVDVSAWSRSSFRAANPPNTSLYVLTQLSPFVLFLFSFLLGLRMHLLELEWY